MEVTSVLLVAMMFVVLLTIGIGNILMTLAAMVDRRSRLSASRLHISWIVLLLLVYFSLFWYTLDVLSVEDWTFSEFLYVMLGPVLILFPSQVLSSPIPPETTFRPRANATSRSAALSSSFSRPRSSGSTGWT